MEIQAQLLDLVALVLAILCGAAVITVVILVWQAVWHVFFKK